MKFAKFNYETAEPESLEVSNQRSALQHAIENLGLVGKLVDLGLEGIQAQPGHKFNVWIWI